MFSFIQQLFQKRFVRFLGVGVINTVFGYSVFFILATLGVYYPIAVLVANLLGIIFNYFTIGRVVFASKDHRLLYKFVLLYLFLYAINVGALSLFKGSHIDVRLGNAIILIPLALISYTLNKKFVFKQPLEDLPLS